MRINRRAICVGVFLVVAVPCWGNAVKYAIATVGPPGIFTGPYRYLGVIELGIDVELFGVSAATLDSPAAFQMIGDGVAPDDPTNTAASDDRPVSLELINKGSDWSDPSDDCILVQVGQKLPKVEGGWRSYGFHIPSYRTSLPSGWTVRGACADSPDAAWNQVMGFVGEARFVIGDLAVQYPAQT